jgi:hypothetical protein
MGSFEPLIGSFAVWGTLFSACDCSLTYLRKKVGTLVKLALIQFRKIHGMPLLQEG